MKTCLSIRIAPEIKEQLQARADKERRSISQFVALLIEEYLKEDRNGNSN